MTKRYQPFITDKELRLQFKNGFKKICKLNYKKNVETIALGFILPIEMLAPIIIFMDRWVSAVEKKLGYLEKGTNEYADWFSIRGFTYDEHRWAVETKISEEKIKRVPVYDFLYLDDAIAVEEFKIKYGSPEYSMRENYLKALADITEVEIPILHEFLCKTKLTLHYPIDAFMKHSYMLGQSSSGKSEFIKHLIHELIWRIKSKKTIILIEPHKDLSTECIALRALWNRGKRNVIYLDPDISSTANDLCEKQVHEYKYSFCINPFDIDTTTPSGIQFLVEHLSEAFFSLIDSEESHQMLALIEACVETLLLKPNSDILDLKRFMDDKNNGDLVQFAIDNLKGERLDLMQNRFLQDSKIQPTKSSIYYRLQSILGKKALLNCLKEKSTINLQECINSGKTIICNFNKAKLGQDGAQMLGKLVVALISGYATLRQTQRKEERTRTFVLLDEFQNYISERSSTGQMFAEQRKYKIYFFVANQQMGQSMSTEIKRLIAGNTAIKLMGPNENDSIEWLSKQYKRLPNNSTFRLLRYSFWCYDKFNSTLGSFILRSPSHLVNQNSGFYLNKQELEKAFNYLIKESGIYRITTEGQYHNSSDSTSPNPINPIFNHNFTE